MTTQTKVAGYVSWRNNLIKKWSDGGKHQVTHLTLHTPLNGESPITLCGRYIPGYDWKTGIFTDDKGDWCYIPDGPFRICPRCERKENENG